MTTPIPQGNVGGLIGNLLGGASGSLGGTNPLQNSIDSLTRAVNALTNTIASSNMGGGTGGQATRQQGPTGTQPFPSMQNQFQPNGGGGVASLGQNNITQPNPFGNFANRSSFGMVAGAVTQFGQNQMTPLLTLNQYATTSMLGMNTNGMSQSNALAMLYRQAGVTPGSLNTIATSPADAIGSIPTLNQLAGTVNLNSSALGRAGLTATAAFGVSNPTLGATQSSQLAAALYSPQFSQSMLQLGYGRGIRSMSPGGAPLGAGQSAQLILQGLGLNKMNPANLYGNLSSPRGQASLSALFGSSGISNTTAAAFLESYNQLFSRGVSANKANQLFNTAAFGNLSQAKAARSTLSKYGVTTANSDIAALTTSQSVVTGRESTYAGGFNSAIQSSTGLLEQFNSALTNIIKNTGLGSALGFGGGFGGVLSGTSHAVGSIGTLGGLLSISKLLRGGSIGAKTTSGDALDLIAGGSTGAGGAAGGASVAALGSALGGAAGMAMVESFMGSLGSKLGLHLGSSSSTLARGVASGLGNAAMQMPFLGPAISFLTGHSATMGGGAAAAVTSQQKTSGNNQQGGISSQAKAAVSAAESQKGVPYVYGDEIPGVGFDCSGLVQWAYKQAGINLPRTSQAMWADLKKRRVSLNQVQEGDLLFAAGSDGTPDSPGHVGMMVSNKQLIQAPYTGQDVQVTGYNPGGWLYAARPSGSGAFGSSSTSSAATSLTAATPGAGLTGNRGAGSGGGTYGSVNEVDVINAMGGGGGGMGGSLVGSGGNGASNSTNTNGTSGKSGSVAGISGGGSVAANKKLMQQMAQAMYGWGTGSQWTALNTLEMHEAGYNNNAQNPTSTAFGIGQFLNQTWAGYGPKTSNPKLQIEYMLEYIKKTYGSPTAAWNQYYDHPGGVGWYGAGGMVQPGLSIVGERGPELMMQTPGGGTQVFSNAQTMALINQIKGSPAQSPWKTDVTNGSQPNGVSQSRPIQVVFNANSIQIQSTGGDSISSKAGREVARQIVKHIQSESVSEAIRNGQKL